MASRRIATLDGLRGWAALAVVFYHSLLATDPRIVPEVMQAGLGEQQGLERVLLKLALACCSGEVAVAVFFVLSGLVLRRALDRLDRDTGGSAPRAAWRFLLRRFLRIWPAMAVCLLVQFELFRAVDAAWPNHLAPRSNGDLLANLVLARYPINGATWTLLVEMAAVPLLLLCFYGTRRLGRWVVPALGAYVVAAIKFKALLAFSTELRTGFPFLLAGVAVADGLYDKLLRPGRRTVAGVAALAVLGAGLLFAPANLLPLRLAAMLVAVPVLVALAGTAGPGVVDRVLRAPLSQLLGVLSFSLYLWNVPVFELLIALVGPATASAHPLATGLGVGAMATLLTLPVAALSERWIERPGIRLGQVLTRPTVSAVTRAATTRC